MQKQTKSTTALRSHGWINKLAYCFTCGLMLLFVCGGPCHLLNTVLGTLFSRAFPPACLLPYGKYKYLWVCIITSLILWIFKFWVCVSSQCSLRASVCFKGIFRRKFNPWSSTLWHRVRFPIASFCSFSNLRKDCTITIHCSLCLHQETAIKKATHCHK